MTSRQFLTAALSVIVLCGTTLSGQRDAAAAKSRDPEVAAQLKAFGEAIKAKRFARDRAAVEIIDGLQLRFEGMHPADKKDFANALGAVFKGRNKRRKPGNPLTRTAVIALGDIGSRDPKIGPVASKTLVAAYRRSPFSTRQWTVLREVMLENIGQTKDKGQVAFLIKQATNPPLDGIKAAAGKALRHFAELKLPARKKIYNKLMVNYTSVEDGAHNTIHPGDTNVQTFKRTLEKIARPWNQTLAALSGQEFRTAAEWRLFWNNHKGDNWDKK